MDNKFQISYEWNLSPLGSSSTILQPLTNCQQAIFGLFDLLPQLKDGKWLNCFPWFRQISARMIYLEIGCSNCQQIWLVDRSSTLPMFYLKKCCSNVWQILLFDRSSKLQLPLLCSSAILFYLENDKKRSSSKKVLSRLILAPEGFANECNSVGRLTMIGWPQVKERNLSVNLIVRTRNLNFVKFNRSGPT